MADLTDRMLDDCFHRQPEETFIYTAELPRRIIIKKSLLDSRILSLRFFGGCIRNNPGIYIEESLNWLNPQADTVFASGSEFVKLPYRDKISPDTGIELPVSQKEAVWEREMQISYVENSGEPITFLRYAFDKEFVKQAGGRGTDNLRIEIVLPALYIQRFQEDKACSRIKK